MSGNTQVVERDETGEVAVTERRAEARRAQMRRSGVAALLPALFLAALYVAAPFAGTSTHAIAAQTPIASVALPDGDSWSRAQAASGATATQRDASTATADSTRSAQSAQSNPSFGMRFPSDSAHTMLLWWGGIAVLALGVLGLAAVARRE